MFMFAPNGKLKRRTGQVIFLLNIFRGGCYFQNTAPLKSSSISKSSYLSQRIFYGDFRVVFYLKSFLNMPKVLKRSCLLHLKDYKTYEENTPGTLLYSLKTQKDIQMSPFLRIFDPNKNNIRS
jgi:hypothetical protein